MNILITGASGYVGKELALFLHRLGHNLYLLARNKSKIHPSLKKMTIIEQDLLHTDCQFPTNIDIAYFLIHSMRDDPKNFDELEKKIAHQFIHCLKKTKVKQVIYLSGLHQGSHLSKHFQSRLNIENILKSSNIPITILRASIIIGSDSASYKIIKDLVNHLIVMIAPKWALTLSQPIAISDVLFYLANVLGDARTFNQTFEIGGADVLSFKEMLQIYAQEKKIKRWIFIVPVLTPKLSSYWLYLVTRVNYALASTLIESLKVNSTIKDYKINHIFPHQCLNYRESIRNCD